MKTDLTKRKKRNKKIIYYGCLPLVVGFFVLVILSVIFADDQGDSSVVEKTKVENNKRPLLTQQQIDSIAQVEKLAKHEKRKSQTIRAKALYNTYQANEVSADNKFKNKNFYVEGIVEKIGKDLFGNIYLALKTGNIIGSVQCFIDDANVAANLQKGQRITVFGKCDGLMMNVLMKDCKVVENMSD